MNITLALDENLVKQVCKIASERDTTLEGLVREYFEKLANESPTTSQPWRAFDALERTFEEFHFRMGERKWKRTDLYDPY